MAVIPKESQSLRNSMKGISLSEKGKTEKSICNVFPFLCIFLHNIGPHLYLHKIYTEKHLRK